MKTSMCPCNLCKKYTRNTYCKKNIIFIPWPYAFTSRKAARTRQSWLKYESGKREQLHHQSLGVALQELTDGLSWNASLWGRGTWRVHPRAFLGLFIAWVFHPIKHKSKHILFFKSARVFNLSASGISIIPSGIRSGWRASSLSSSFCAHSILRLTRLLIFSIHMQTNAMQ